MTTQVPRLTRLTAANPTWLIVDRYIDIVSGKTGSSHKKFNRMLKGCASDKVDLVLAKSISRFGRNSLKVLPTLEQSRETNSRVTFKTEEIDTEKTDSRWMSPLPRGKRIQK